jgi:hypothetical protein
MLNLITECLPYAFPGGHTLKLVKNGINITNSTNPLSVATNVTLTVVDCCAPPPLRLIAYCIGASALIEASVASPNPVTIGSAIHLIKFFIIWYLN